MENEAHILLVEDNHMDVILTLDAFKEARLKNTIHVARNGQEALDYLFGKDKYANRDEFPIPKIDGFEVLRQVKSTEKLKRIPIVILTSSKEEGDRALSYDIGANSYLLKPVSFEGFTEVVKKIDDYWFSLNIKPPENS